MSKNNPFNDPYVDAMNLLHSVFSKEDIEAIHSLDKRLCEEGTLTDEEIEKNRITIKYEDLK